MDEQNKRKELSTPRKSGNSTCLICGSIPKQRLKIESYAGEKKNLKELLLKYCEVNVLEGYLCRNCEQKLINLDKKARELKEQCLRNWKSKRCAQSPTGMTPMSKKNERMKVTAGETPHVFLKTARTQLQFSGEFGYFM